MVTLYVAGRPVGPLSDAVSLIPKLSAMNQPVEFRNDDGTSLGTFLPDPSSAAAGPPVPWDPTITWEVVERRRLAPGLTYDEVKRRLGWE